MRTFELLILISIILKCMLHNEIVYFGNWMETYSTFLDDIYFALVL